MLAFGLNDTTFEGGATRVAPAESGRNLGTLLDMIAAVRVREYGELRQGQ